VGTSTTGSPSSRGRRPDGLPIGFKENKKKCERRARVKARWSAHRLHSEEEKKKTRKEGRRLLSIRGRGGGEQEQEGMIRPREGEGKKGPGEREVSFLTGRGEEGHFQKKGF